MEELLKQLLEGQKQIIERLERVEHSQLRMEQDHGNKLSALFDAREVQFDVNERICDTLNRIEGKMDRLTLKVSSHDTKLRQAK